MSLSSNLVSGITAFRNPNGPEQVWTSIFPGHDKSVSLWRVVTAEVGYIVVIPIAIVETALSAVAKLFSLCLPIGQENHEKMSRWLSSSAFSVAWALTDALINLCCQDLIVTEKVAMACARSGNFFEVPAASIEQNANPSICGCGCGQSHGTLLAGQMARNIVAGLFPSVN